MSDTEVSSTAPQDRVGEPATVSPLAVLSALDAKLLRYETIEAWPSGPWLMASGGREWAVATDGHALLAVHRELVEGDCTEIPATVATLALKWLTAAETQAATATAARLRAFAGMHTDKPLCLGCEGRGTVDRRGSGTQKCPTCKGKDAPFRDNIHAPGLLLGTLVNRRILASVLAVAHDDDLVSVAVVPLPGIVLRGPTWFAIVMPLLDGSMKPQAVFDAGDTKQASGDDPVEPTKVTDQPLTTLENR